MSDKKDYRVSVSIDSKNTQNLKSIFEQQMKAVEASGNAVRNRRSRAISNTSKTLGAVPAQPSQPSPSWRRQTTTTTATGTASPSSSGANSNGSSSLSPGPKKSAPPSSGASPASVPSKGPVSPVVKAAAPFVVKPAAAVAPDPLEESGQRTRPKVKPKVDPNRMTVKFSAPPVVPEPVEPEPVVPEPLVVADPKDGPARGRGISLYDYVDVGEKYRIQYDELEFDELVSEGSAGEVYLGYYFGTPVAIKKLFALPPDQRHLVAREFSMLQGVNHPNIVQFLGICDHESGIYLITEYIEHGDLFDMLIFGTGSIPWKEKVSIALQLGQAMYYLHSRKILHRDLKSQNILIGANNRIKLCDLGLATVLEAKKRMTVCGTNEWMAPEIMMQDNYDNKVDVFSFGIVMTELLTEQPPKKREFDKMLAFNVEQFKESTPADSPPEFCQLVIDCTKFKPEERPDFKEIVSRLRKLQLELDG